MILVDGDFKAIFTAVTAAGGIQLNAVPVERAARHEDQFFHARRQARQRIDRLGPLEGQQGPIRHQLDTAALADPVLDVGDVGGFAGAVDDDKQIVTRVDEHQVIHDAAFVVEQQAITLFADPQADYVHRHQGFKSSGGIGAYQPQLAHV